MEQPEKPLETPEDWRAPLMDKAKQFARWALACPEIVEKPKPTILTSIRSGDHEVNPEPHHVDSDFTNVLVVFVVALLLCYIVDYFVQFFTGKQTEHFDVGQPAISHRDLPTTVTSEAPPTSSETTSSACAPPPSSVAMASNKMLDLILESSPHLQEILMSEFSAFDLIRLSTVTREARLVSLRQLGRRKINLLINTPDDQIMHMTVDENGAASYQRMIRKNYAGALIELAKNSRIRRLEFMQSDRWVTTIAEQFWYNDDLDETTNDFHVDTIKFQLSDFNTEILKYFTPSVLIMTSNESDHDYYGEETGRLLEKFSYRGFMNCEELHVDDRDRTNDVFSRPPINVALQSVKAATVNLSPYSRITYKDVYNFIRAYQLGRRDIRYFICGVELTKKMTGLDKFIDHMLKSLPVSDEIPYPAEAQMNNNVVEHMTKMAELWTMNTRVPSRALRVGGPHDGRHLVVVVRQFNYRKPKKYEWEDAMTTALALGIYERDN